jgi:hypothetical protein
VRARRRKRAGELDGHESWAGEAGTKAARARELGGGYASWTTRVWATKVWATSVYTTNVGGKDRDG